MNEVDCPYCGKLQSLDTDEFREDGQTQEETCDSCGKKFISRLSISWNYYGETLSDQEGNKT